MPETDRSKLMSVSTFDACVQVGQMQLLRKQIAHELNTLCKFDSHNLACALQTMNTYVHAGSVSTLQLLYSVYHPSQQ